MAEGELARRKSARSRCACGNLGPQGARVCRSARNSRRQVHGHPGTGGGARPGRLHVLGFRRPLDPRPALVLEQSRRHPDLRREHQHLGRRGSSAAIRHAIRRRRHSPAAGASGREWRGQTPGVRARHREKDAAVRIQRQGRSGGGHGTRLLAPQRNGRGPDEYCFRHARRIRRRSTR